MVLSSTSIKTLDPAHLFPEIKVKNKSTDPNNEERITKTLEKLNSAKPTKELDEERYETVRHK